MSDLDDLMAWNQLDEAAEQAATDKAYSQFLEDDDDHPDPPPQPGPSRPRSKRG